MAWFYTAINGERDIDEQQCCLKICCLYFFDDSSINLIKENYFALKKARSRRYPAETMTDTDHADDLAFSQIHQPKQNPYSLPRARTRVVLASTQTQIKPSMCVLNKKTLSQV